MTTVVFKPVRSAVLVHSDTQIQVFADATWIPARGSMRGWTVTGDAVIHAEGTGDAHITTSWGHSKVSKVIAPDGTHYSIRDLAVAA